MVYSILCSLVIVNHFYCTESLRWPRESLWSTAGDFLGKVGLYWSVGFVSAKLKMYPHYISDATTPKNMFGNSITI